MRPGAAAKEVAEGVRAEIVGSEHQQQSSDAGRHHDGHDVGATADRQVGHEADRQKQREQKGGHMRRRGKSEGQGEQHNARAPLTWGPLHGVGYAHGGVERGEQSKCGENFVVGIGTGVNHREEKSSTRPAR